MADIMVRIIEDKKIIKNGSMGIADADTQGEDRPVY